MTVPEILSKLWPVLVLQVILQGIALFNLRGRSNVRFGNKWIWVIIIVLGGILGPVAYFSFRGENHEDSSND